MLDDGWSNWCVLLAIRDLSACEEEHLPSCSRPGRVTRVVTNLISTIIL